MTLEEIQALVVSVDPNAGHYESAYQGSDAYTVWRETSTLSFMGDNRHLGALKFQIDRFTRQEGDLIAFDLEAALELRDDIAFVHITDHEPDTRYIHHIFDCEAI